jgi:hypothetical protein
MPYVQSPPRKSLPTSQPGKIYESVRAICETDQNVVPGPTDRIFEMVGDVEGLRGVKNVENNRGCMVDGNPRQGLFIMVSIAFPDISA